jgi:O-antigen ligase
MFSVRSLVQFFIALNIAVLPLAHLKVLVFGLPIYSVELPLLLAGLAYAYGWQQQILPPVKAVNICHPFVLGISLFLLGALISFGANPFSLTGLGMLKTWFIFPLGAVWLWMKTMPTVAELERILLVWFGTSLVTAGVSLGFFWRGILTYDGRLEAWYTSPNYLAFMLAPGTLLAGYFLSRPSAFFRQPQFSQIFFLFALSILAFALFLTHSYTAWISLLAALALFIFLGRVSIFSGRKKMALLVLLAGVFATGVFLESGSDKWQSLATLSPRSSIASRVMIWESATRIIADHPVLGIGLGRFQETYLAYQQYFPPYLEWAVPQPHNLYLALWLQTGLIGLCGFCLLVVAWIRRMSRLLCSAVSADTKKISALLLALLTFFLILGLADTPFFKTDLAFMFWFLIAFGVGLLNGEKKRSV